MTNSTPTPQVNLPAGRPLPQKGDYTMVGVKKPDTSKNAARGARKSPRKRFIL